MIYPNDGKRRVHGVLLFAQIQPNVSKLIGQSFAMQIDIDLKHALKATFF